MTANEPASKRDLCPLCGANEWLPKGWTQLVGGIADVAVCGRCAFVRIIWRED